MALIERKRQRKKDITQPRKKRKGDEVVRLSAKGGTEARTISLETLPWHQVPFPENFQDAEGFFGLEELSDVDVIRKSGNIEYKVRSAKVFSWKRLTRFI